MSVDRETVLAVLDRLSLPDGSTLLSRHLIRALVIEQGDVRFVIEADSPDQARALEPIRLQAETALRALPG